VTRDVRTKADKSLWYGDQARTSAGSPAASPSSRTPIIQRREARTDGHCTSDGRVSRRNLRDALLILFGVISVVNGAFGNGHLLIAVLGAIALAVVAWQRRPRTASA
jgi:hypothetical protein